MWYIAWFTWSSTEIFRQFSYSYLIPPFLRIDVRASCACGASSTNMCKSLDCLPPSLVVSIGAESSIILPLQNFEWITYYMADNKHLTNIDHTRITMAGYIEGWIERHELLPFEIVHLANGQDGISFYDLVKNGCFIVTH